MKNLILSAFFSLIATIGLAGPQYIDGSDYAVSGYDVVAYFSLPQSKVGKKQVGAVPGRKDITADYNGAKFAFSTKANRDLFVANPAKYVPQYDGHCAYGVSQGNKVPGNPDLWRIVDGKLYLNITRGVERVWDRDIPGYIKSANQKWGRLESRRASRDRVPSFRSSAPLTN
ncbi:hypothetical protein N9L47_10420 [Rhodobacteraceae bacterium]|nr:hypothetical protein [Paracoccaceae bacterium]